MERVNRKQIVAVVVAALVVVAAVVIILSVTAGDDEVSPDSIEDVALIQEMFLGVPQDGATVGETDAPVEIIEFGDLQCPACAITARETLPELMDQFVRPGTAKLTFVPIAFLGDDSERGALGAEAAALQDGMWPFISLLYHNQGGENSGWLSDAVMRAVADQVGLDVGQWETDYAGDEVATAFFEAAARAEEAGVPSTPTFLIRGPDGDTTFSGAQEIDAFAAAIEEVGGA
jgi:protein-disulfide isomerase